MPLQHNLDVHRSVAEVGLCLEPTRPSTSPPQLQKPLCKACMRLEDVRHLLSRVTFACLCKFVERPAQPLFELFSLGSPLGSGSCLLFHFSLVTLYQRQRSADGFLRPSQAWLGEPKLSYHGMGTRVYSTVEPRYHVEARCGRVSFSCPFWALVVQGANLWSACVREPSTASPRKGTGVRWIVMAKIP